MSDLHQEGRFRARAVEGAWGHTSNGVVQVAVMFELETGAKLTWYGYMTEKAEERTMNSLIACGVTDLETLEGVDSNDVEVTIEHDTYNDKTRAKIAWVNALGTGGVAMKSKIDGAEKKSVLSKYKGNFLKLQKAQGVAPAKPAAKQKATGTDDIPF